jgi:ubiquitin carboxyl-terminal hydrolase 4/11/15
VDLKVVLADYIKGDALRMNKYTDAPFNIVAKSGGLSVRSCIEQFGRKEVLGVGDEWYCSKCKQHQRAAKKM